MLLLQLADGALCVLGLRALLQQTLLPAACDCDGDSLVRTPHHAYLVQSHVHVQEASRVAAEAAHAAAAKRVAELELEVSALRHGMDSCHTLQLFRLFPLV